MRKAIILKLLTVTLGTFLAMTIPVVESNAQSLCTRTSTGTAGAGYVEIGGFSYGAYVYDGYIQLIKARIGGAWEGEVAYINLKQARSSHVRYFSSTGTSYNYDYRKVFSSGMGILETIWYAYGTEARIYYRNYSLLSPMYSALTTFFYSAEPQGLPVCR
jgi:hypothetical protein